MYFKLKQPLGKCVSKDKPYICNKVEGTVQAQSFWQTSLPWHTVSHVTLLVSSGKFMSGSAFFLSPPENKKAKFAFCTLKRKGGSTQKQPFLTVRFRGALLTKSVTLEFSQDTVCGGTNFDIILRLSSWSSMAAPPPIFRVIIILEVMVSMVLMAPTTPM